MRFQGPTLLEASPPLCGHVSLFPSEGLLSQQRPHLLLMITEAQLPRGVHPANAISVPKRWLGLPKWTSRVGGPAQGGRSLPLGACSNGAGRGL